MSQEYNVRLVTLDSCRYDTALNARTPNLDKIAPLRKAETSGSYTYPAHHAFFSGNLPRIVEGDPNYLPGYDQIWRSSRAREKTPVIFTYEAPHIIAHHQENGYNVQGFGGVGFFNTNDRNNMLPEMFKNFTYVGYPSNIPPQDRLPRAEYTFPLGNLDMIAERVSGEKPYFLFINSPETHTPYDVPGTNVDDHYKELLERVNREHTLQVKYSKGEFPFSDEELDFLRAQQVTALEWIDQRIGQLFDMLPKTHPTITVVCADHGDEFGENGRMGHAHNDETVMVVPVWAGFTQ